MDPADSRHLAAQWRGSARVSALADLVADVVRERSGPALALLSEMREVDTAAGWHLDALGLRVGIRRPSERASGDGRFGFDDAGRGFGRGAYRGDAANDVLEPLGDEAFRRLVRARAALVLGDGSTSAFSRAARMIDPSAVVDDRRDMSLVVYTDRIGQMRLADESGALPRTAGVMVEYRDRGRFGLDSAGTGFDQGAYR